MARLYPLQFKPILKSAIWGGRRLAKFGRPLPPGAVVSESWEIAAHEDGMTTVINGAFAGRTLPELLALLGEDLVGSQYRWALERGKFPLLIKLLDAHQRLSLQVHPQDAYAMAHEGNELGKSEMWVVLAADPGAAVVYGLARQVTPEALARAVASDDLESYLHVLPIRAGDHICVPSGTLHAILKGSVILEVQQNSNTTYRVYDWGRVGSDGQRRELHLQKALDVIRFDQIGQPLPAAKLLEEMENVRRELLCENQYFRTERVILSGAGAMPGVCDGTSLEIWVALAGGIRIGELALEAVQMALLPAAMGDYAITWDQDATLLRVRAGTNARQNG